ncbi:MAG: hypothetical protein AAF675_21525, partial [Pseudomonadota bacterium]
IAQATAPVVAVMIDGARMVSPGLLRAALDALGDDPKAVAGVHGLHLGPVLHQEAAEQGYDQATEDALLAELGWRDDGYRLFEKAVLSKSSGKGWRELPSETTALFMHRAAWEALNGYDERFQSPGGGLANLDIWKRATERRGAEVTILLGEATFHQIHGGASTGTGPSPRARFDREYEAVRGKPYERPAVSARFVGEAPGGGD